MEKVYNDPDEPMSYAGPEWERPQDPWEFIHTVSMACAAASHERLVPGLQQTSPAS